MLLQGSIIDSTHDHDSPWPFCRVHGRGGLQRPGQCEDWMIDHLYLHIMRWGNKLFLVAVNFSLGVPKLSQVWLSPSHD